MTILVDDLTDYPGKPHGFRQWCHMMTDDHTEAGLVELHAMAARIGLRRAWFQDKPGFPHYDLTAARRAAALKIGAQAVHSFELVRRCKRPINQVKT